MNARRDRTPPGPRPSRPEWSPSRPLPPGGELRPMAEAAVRPDAAAEARLQRSRSPPPPLRSMLAISSGAGGSDLIQRSVPRLAPSSRLTESSAPSPERRISSVLPPPTSITTTSPATSTVAPAYASSASSRPESTTCRDVVLATQRSDEVASVDRLSGRARAGQNEPVGPVASASFTYRATTAAVRRRACLGQPAPALQSFPQTRHLGAADQLPGLPSRHLRHQQPHRDGPHVDGRPPLAGDPAAAPAVTAPRLVYRGKKGRPYPLGVAGQRRGPGRRRRPASRPAIRTSPPAERRRRHGDTRPAPGPPDRRSRRPVGHPRRSLRPEQPGALGRVE